MQYLLFVLEYSKIWWERLVSIQGKWFYNLNPLEMKGRTEGLEMQQKETTSSERLKKELKYNKVGRTDVEAETPILWPPDVKSWLIWKDPDAGKDWVQEEKGTTEDVMIGWHHWLNGHGFGWTPGVGDGQGGLACCDSWGHKESDTTEHLNWTEKIIPCVIPFIQHSSDNKLIAMENWRLPEVEGAGAGQQVWLCNSAAGRSVGRRKHPVSWLYQTPWRWYPASLARWHHWGELGKGYTYESMMITEF